MDVPQLTLKDFEERFGALHLLHEIVSHWARTRPDAIALIDADRNRQITWAEFDQAANMLAHSLLRRGFTKGDCLATMLPLTPEHVFLEFACFKIGMIFVPLDLRLQLAEVQRSLTQVAVRGFVFLKLPGTTDPAAFGSQMQSQLDLRLLAQFSRPEECSPDVTPFTTLLQAKPSSAAAMPDVDENDGALAIFTTGSTGSPKPALLSHRSISCQAMCISQALLQSGEKPLVTLVNLPASHVGCQTELLIGTLFHGGTAVLLPVFDALRSMRAIEQHKVTVIGQIPAMFQFEWRLKEYGSFDLSSLEFAAYGGQQASTQFLDKMAEMAPMVGTGLGLTETAGFCTYIRRARDRARDCVMSLGAAMPIYPMSIRSPMRSDGTAGPELPEGQLGDICFRGPQTFLGYINDPAATAATISRDGYLYTGDMGYHDNEGLHLAGRAKFVLKPSGYQVFPRDIEDHFSSLDLVEACAAIGVPHPVTSEAILLFVEKKPGVDLSRAVLERHARTLASYMRPRHYVVLEPGQLPLNRTAKADYLALRGLATDEVERLKAAGNWARD